MEPDTNEGLGSGLSRRKFVAGSAAGFATVAVAGCSGENGDAPATTTEEPEPQPENYVVTDDLIVSSTNAPVQGGFAQACSPSRTFMPGMHPVFKIGVYDPETGDVMGNDTLDSVSVDVEGFGTVDLNWAGDDEEHAAEEWTSSWEIPVDAEPGTVNYTVQVSNGDANFTNVGILESSFTIIENQVDYIFTDDLYTGSAGVSDYEDNAFVSSCQPDRQFAPNMMIGFDIGIYEANSGMPVSPPDFEYEDSVQGPIDMVEVVIEKADDTPGEVEDAVKTVELGWAGYEGEHAEKGQDLYYNGVWHMENEDTPVEPGDYQYTVNVHFTEDAAPHTDGKLMGALASTFTVVDA